MRNFTVSKPDCETVEGGTTKRLIPLQPQFHSFTPLHSFFELSTHPG